MIKNPEFYFSVIDDKKSYFIYSSERFRLSEPEILALIRICIKQARARAIGRKILFVYKDVMKDDVAYLENKLKEIGIIEKHEKPQRRRIQAKNYR